MNIEDYFSQGNYVAVAMNSPSDDWHQHAALGLLGRTNEAIRGLEQYDQEDARFYSAVASWIGGDDERAVRLLGPIQTPHAQNLLALIAKPQIHVLAQLPWPRNGAHALKMGARHDKKFSVRNVSFHWDDFLNRPYADVHEFVDPGRTPDFYICTMVEWHLIPPNIQDLLCPILGHTADFDLHIQCVYPWLQVFDELIVTDHTEWADVRRLVALPVSTFPKAFSIPAEFPPPTFGERPIDVFVSGSLLHPYFAEKASLFHQVLAIPGIEPLLVDGFLSGKKYAKLLSQSKICFTHVRHPGAMPTRGLEALAMGCVVLTQPESTLGLYVGEESGVMPYQAHNVADAIERVLSTWPEYEQRARLGASSILAEFSREKVASQYLRFLTFLAARPRGPRNLVDRETLTQKRTILGKGWRFEPSVYASLRNTNVLMWEETLRTDPRPDLFIDMARENVLGYLEDLNSARDSPHLLNRAVELYREGLSLFPDCIVLRLNFIRVLFHFGTQKQVAEAVALAEETILRAESLGKADVHHDVFPWDFFEKYFNYRRYFDAVTRRLMGEGDETVLLQLILSALHHYIGLYTHDLGHLETAVKLDPEYAFFQLHYVQALLLRGRPPDYEKADKILESLADGSIVFRAAADRLHELYMEGRYISGKSIQLEEKRRRVAEVYCEIDGLGAGQDLKGFLPALPPAPVSVTVEKELAKPHDLKVSFVFVEYFGRRNLEAVEALRKNATKRSLYEIVVVAMGRSLSTSLDERADMVVMVEGNQGNRESVGYNIGLVRANGSVVTFCRPESRFREDFAERLLQLFSFNSSRTPRAVFVDDRNTATFSCRKIDAVIAEGFDESNLCSDGFSRLYNLSFGLAQMGLQAVVMDDRSHGSGHSGVAAIAARFRVEFALDCWNSMGVRSPEIQALKSSLTRIWPLFSRELAFKLGVSGFPLAKRLPILREARRMSWISLRAVAGAWLLGKLQKAMGLRLYQALGRFYPSGRQPAVMYRRDAEITGKLQPSPTKEDLET